MLAAAADLDIPVQATGCYVGVDGPRYETRAEIAMYHRLGGDVIGMTNIPEVVMAREAGMCYATLAMVSNLGAGLCNEPVTSNRIAAETARMIPAALSVLARTLTAPSPIDCHCCSPKPDFFTSLDT
jgi:5'-methylthioadenosine phosphorylase